MNHTQKKKTLVMCTLSNINILRSLCTVCYYFWYWWEIPSYFELHALTLVTILMRSWYYTLFLHSFSCYFYPLFPPSTRHPMAPLMPGTPPSPPCNTSCAQSRPGQRNWRNRSRPWRARFQHCRMSSKAHSIHLRRRRPPLHRPANTSGIPEKEIWWVNCTQNVMVQVSVYWYGFILLVHTCVEC